MHSKHRVYHSAVSLRLGSALVCFGIPYSGYISFITIKTDILNKLIRRVVYDKAGIASGVVAGFAVDEI